MEPKKEEGEAIIGFIIFIIIIVIIAVVIDHCDMEEPCEYNKSEKRIYSLHTKEDTEANFFLGIGNVNNELKYYFYKEKGNGMILESKYAENVKLVETDNKKPSFIESHCDCYDCKYNYTIDTLYIPEDTVKKEYNIDIK